MVRLDNEAGSLVTLRFHQPYADADEADYLAALETLAALTEPFVLLTVFGGGPGLSQAGERAQALWFKRSRGAMQHKCRACAIVRPNASDDMAAVFRRLWSFPIHATPDEGEARRMLSRYMTMGNMGVARERG
ncbi:hypothetical protein G3545_05230 [Starkeya sp. ORNL1]|uniref:hypothetical protein n=1 Tax=Starkeya sp. ORNL1 TaxID=2709380 RepID=UPI0014633E41|nr:hypothetical protein [Starkeya sp. ORNL1]QJP13104.1 hypothetical protein G3545_05230 [Starkeya sp. ORNL1]